MVHLTLDPSWFDYPDVPLPDVWTVECLQPAPLLDGADSAAGAAARTLADAARLPAGASVAVGVGSRGITGLEAAVRAVVAALKTAGLRPFIVPAMGSHGGATAEGQAAVLASYGVTEERVGAPVRASMDVVQLAALEDGYPVYLDRLASEADAILVVNRIKPHTDFHGRIESGLAKMCSIGLGKRLGADAIHRFGADGLRERMPRIARRVVECANVIGGVAILENLYGQTAEVHAVGPAGIGAGMEEELLRRARSLSPRLPFAELDVLIVDEMGKDISGSGMDTHVLGRARIPSIREEEWDGPHVRIVCALDLSERSHGNAAGIGLADMVTRRLVERVDWQATMTNHRTSGEGGVQRGHIPLVLEDGAACARAAIAACGRGGPVRLARIRSTARVRMLQVTQPLAAEARDREDLRVVGGPHPLDPDTKLEVG
ncbi:MAG: DUF2088 domain-containing protein [Chthonomonadales bacterium]|nr:DUF2088 domain-containing protein [Chthonomonadales bacterium]